MGFLYLLGVMGQWCFFIAMTLVGIRYGGAANGSMTYILFWAGICILSLAIFVSRMIDRQGIRISAVKPIALIIVVTVLLGINFLIHDAVESGNIRYSLIFFATCVPSCLLGAGCGLEAVHQRLVRAMHWFVVCATPVLLLNTYRLISGAGMVSQLDSFGGMDRLGAGYMAAQFYALTLFALMSRSQSDDETLSGPFQTRWGIRAAVPMLLIQLGNVIVAGSRGPLVAVMAVTLYVVFRSGQGNRVYARLRGLMVVAGGALLLLYALNTGGAGIFSASTSRTLTLFSLGSSSWAGGSGRESLYSIAWAMFKESPLWGHGPLGFLSDSGTGTNPHNIVLELLVDYGLLGATLWVLFFSVVYRKYRRLFLADHSSHPLLLLIIITGVDLFFSGSFLFQAQFWFFLGYGLSVEFSPEDEMDEEIAGEVISSPSEQTLA